MTVFAPRRDQPLIVNDRGVPRLYDYFEDSARTVNQLTDTNTNAYTVTNTTTDRTYDANATSIDELADVLGTLIADLKAAGIVP